MTVLTTTLQCRRCMRSMAVPYEGDGPQRGDATDLALLRTGWVQLAYGDIVSTGVCPLCHSAALPIADNPYRPTMGSSRHEEMRLGPQHVIEELGR